MSLGMQRMAAGLKTETCRVELFHITLPGCEWDVWGFNFKHQDKYYWTWKPFVLEKAIDADHKYKGFEEDGTTMDDLMQNMRAAPVREVPCGANVPAIFPFKNGNHINREVLFCLIQSPSTEEDIRLAAKELFKQFDNVKIRQCYEMAMGNEVRNDNMLAECGPKGILWDKLKAGSSNMTYTRLESLNHIFLDEKIEEIIRVAYGMEDDKGCSMWPKDVLMAAFGVVKTEEE